MRQPQRQTGIIRPLISIKCIATAILDTGHTHRHTLLARTHSQTQRQRTEAKRNMTSFIISGGFGDIANSSNNCRTERFWFVLGICGALTVAAHRPPDLARVFVVT